ncbi:eukaryotic translation initiation factor 3 [Thraustotheca clavata]|uniref:Eukaryotic translation initiation factor 3 n=1 Tax=Thraustotheca clavata TaxID=74557 RepID=A0A1W0A6H9_9STRA|nr:eukaryotic translation initiation factor 3 [Thraustotheca clavata]
MASYKVPGVSVNPTGWGPTTLPKQFLNIPYAPFGKGDKLGKAADFISQNTTSVNRPARFGNRVVDPSGVNAEFQYKHDAVEDMSFQLVDTAKAIRSNTRLRPTWGQQRYQANKYNNRNNPNAGKDKGMTPLENTQMKKGQQKLNKRWDRLSNARRMIGTKRRDTDVKERIASVQVDTTWTMIEQFELAQLVKLQANIPAVEDLKTCGKLYKYDDTYDRITTRFAKSLGRHDDKEFVSVTTTDDPVIEGLATEGAATVFATDAILSHLMASPRSVYPWDILVQRVGNMLFFDKRDAATFDLLTVNETAIDPPNADDPDSINHPDRLSLEATLINQNFTQQVLRAPSEFTKEFDHPNPFSGENLAPIAYKYRRFQLSDSIQLVTRCELHAISTKNGNEQTVAAFALNEWDPKLSGNVEWRKKIDLQRGALLATELKNNSCKIAKWTHSAILAGADQMKLGFVTRSNIKDPFSHTILATQSYNPVDFANQTSLNLNNAWGIIKMLVDIFLNQPEGKYVMMKDPNKPVVRIYSVPLNTFDDEDEDDDEDDEQDDEDEDTDV